MYPIYSSLLIFLETYGKKRQQCGALEDIVKDLESQNSEIRKSMHQVKQEYETRLRQLNMANSKNLESSKDENPQDNTESEKRIKELERSLAQEEEKVCNQLSMVKEQYANEIR